MSDYQKYVQQLMTKWQGNPITSVSADPSCPHSVLLRFYNGKALRIDTDTKQGDACNVMPTPFNIPSGTKMGLGMLHA